MSSEKSPLTVCQHCDEQPCCISITYVLNLAARISRSPHPCLLHEPLFCAETTCYAQDWLDIDFAIRQQVDFIAVSFVKSADVIKNLKSYLNSRADKVIEVIAKVESHDSVPNIEEIVEASDAVMVARGDLGKTPHRQRNEVLS